MATKSNKLGIWVVLIVVLVVVAALVYFLLPKKSITGSSSLLPTSSATAIAPSIFPLTYGAKGDEVLQMQAALNDAWNDNKQLVAGPGVKPKYEIAEDGIWGDNTEDMVKWAFGGTGTVTEALYTKYII